MGCAFASISEDRACANPATEHICGLSFCSRHGKLLRESIIYALQEERSGTGITHQIRMAVREWDADDRQADFDARWEAKLRAERTAVVYYAERDGYIKIGVTSDLPKRLVALARGGTKFPPGMSVGPVNLLATHAGGVQAERAMHRRFSADRVVGEWFHASPGLMAHIAAIVQKTAERRAVPAVDTGAPADTGHCPPKARYRSCGTCGHERELSKNGKTWLCVPCQRRRVSEADALVAQARRHLSLGWNEYVSTYGKSAKKAREILSQPPSSVVGSVN